MRIEKMVKIHKESEDVEIEEGIKTGTQEEVKEVVVERVLTRLEAEREAKLAAWVPKTSLGKAVQAGEIKEVETIFNAGKIIREPQIVDFLLRDLRNELIMIGGTPGKGGGKKPTGVKITSRMHKSGRKRGQHALVAIGNDDGIVGLGYATGQNARSTIDKATQNAKLNMISVRRGCGSWECACKKPHSIPFKVEGKSGSVEVKLLPAPRGLGLCADDEAKKILRLAGIKDLWMKSRGETGTRLNFIKAIFNALTKLNMIKVDEQSKKAVGMNEGTAKV